MAAGGKAGPVLPWMRVPITIEAGNGVPIGRVQGLDPQLAKELEKGSGFHELFPVQAAVWQHSGGGLSTAHDLCVAAPTGSGKTLAYALPVVNALAATSLGSGCAGRLRALVVLPTRDLAAQVYDVFRPLCEAVRLRVALAAARTSEAAEAAQLLGAPATAAGGGAGAGGASGGAGLRGPDVVVATPGRLMAHLAGTSGFTLRHLRFLVVDETDRLLRQSYQDWLPGVLERLAPSQQHHPGGQQRAAAGGRLQEPGADPSAGGLLPWAADARGWGGGGGEEEQHFAVRWPAGSHGTVLPYSQPRPVKIVVSATLTRDPAKLQRLALHNPRYVATVASAPGAAAGTGTGAGAVAAAGAGGAAAAAARYSLPRSLSEFRLQCSAARKPLALLALLSEAGAAGQSTIVFTSSLEMTHKLFLMLRAVPELSGGVVEYSSGVPPRERVAALERFRSGGARVLVASDAMTRGMDVDGVHHVINYDAPVYAKTYVHRAGRTARAGRPGRVVTLLRDEDMRHFKAMIRKADNNFVRELKLPPESVDAFRPALAGALQQLEELLAAERWADQQQQQQQAKQERQAAAAAAGAAARAKEKEKVQKDGQQAAGAAGAAAGGKDVDREGRQATGAAAGKGGRQAATAAGADDGGRATASAEQVGTKRPDAIGSGAAAEDDMDGADGGRQRKRQKGDGVRPGAGDAGGKEEQGGGREAGKAPQGELSGGGRSVEAEEGAGTVNGAAGKGSGRAKKKRGAAAGGEVDEVAAEGTGKAGPAGGMVSHGAEAEVEGKGKKRKKDKKA